MVMLFSYLENTGLFLKGYSGYSHYTVQSFSLFLENSGQCSDTVFYFLEKHDSKTSVCPEL